MRNMSAPPPDYNDRSEFLNFTGPILGAAFGTICGLLPDARIFVKGNEPDYQLIFSHKIPDGESRRL